jgi:SP family myo-inositol transporter-like MFS transporter 13
MLCALIVGCGVGLLPIVSGTGITLYYSAMIVKMSGLASVNASIGFLIIVSIVQLLFNFVGLFLVEKLGRRLLTFISLSGMIVSLLLLAVSFYLADLTSKPSCPTDVCFHNSCEECVTQNSCLFCLLPSNSSYSDANSIGYCINHFNSTNDNGECFISESQQLSNVHDKACNAFNDTYSLEINGFYKGSTYSSCPNKYFGLALTSYIIYIITFASGISALPCIIISEIYPNWARSIASSIAFTVYMFGLLISTITFIFISEYLTHFGVFMLYMCLSVTGWIFVLLFLPETKGRSLEDTESLFKSSIFPPPGLRKDLKQLVVT